MGKGERKGKFWEPQQHWRHFGHGLWKTCQPGKEDIVSFPALACSVLFSKSLYLQILTSPHCPPLLPCLLWLQTCLVCFDCKPFRRGMIAPCMFGKPITMVAVFFPVKWHCHTITRGTPKPGKIYMLLSVLQKGKHGFWWIVDIWRV